MDKTSMRYRLCLINKDINDIKNQTNEQISETFISNAFSWLLAPV